MGIDAADALESVANGYIFRAMLSREHLEEIAAGFGGLELPPWPLDSEGRSIIAHAIGDRVLGPRWYFDVVDESSPELAKVRIVVTGLAGDP